MTDDTALCVLHDYLKERQEKELPLSLCLHGTPRQLQDKRRLFVKHEHDIMVKRLQPFLQDDVYFDDGRPASLQMHFDVLREFSLNTAD